MSVHVLSWVFKHSEARLGDRLVLLVLADHASDDGSGAWPSQATIAREARMSERAVRDSLRRLEAMENIERTGVRQSGAIEYGVVMAAPAVIAAPPAESTASRTDSADEPSFEPSFEPSVVEPAKSAPHWGNGGRRGRRRPGSSAETGPRWNAWARENVPELPAPFVESAASMIAYAGETVTADAVRNRVLVQHPELQEEEAA